MGAGLTGSIVLRSGRLSELISQLQELLKGVDEFGVSSHKYDSALIAAQVRQLAQEIKELTLSSPVTIFNGNSASSGSFSSYLVPAAALGAMGYCYMWWKGWSFSDVMFVTKSNMANAVATVSKQLEHVSETLALTKRHLSKRLESLDWKVEEQHETSKLIANNVNEMKSSLSQIDLDVETIHQLISGLEGKIDLLESKQDVTNSGLWHLCQVAGGTKDGINTKLFQDVGRIDSAGTQGEKPLKGLQCIAETSESIEIDKQLTTGQKKNGLNNLSGEKKLNIKTRIHRSYPVGISWARDIMGPAL